jgi:hypothetical protein
LIRLETASKHQLSAKSFHALVGDIFAMSRQGARIMLLPESEGSETRPEDDILYMVTAGRTSQLRRRPALRSGGLRAAQATTQFDETILARSLSERHPSSSTKLFTVYCGANLNPSTPPLSSPVIRPYPIPFSAHALKRKHSALSINSEPLPNGASNGCGAELDSTASPSIELRLWIAQSASGIGVLPISYRSSLAGNESSRLPHDTKCGCEREICGCSNW